MLTSVTHKTEWQQVNILTGRQEFLLSTVNSRKLSWFGHICVMKRCRPRMVDGCYRGGRPRKSLDNIKEETGQSMSSLLRIADDRSRWAAITADASVGVPQRRLGTTGIV